jgi:hydroxypyruvate reductase
LDAKPFVLNAKSQLIIIAFGKASCAMMEQALQHAPSGQAVKAIAVPNYENAREIEGCRVIAAGHPLPDHNGINAGTAVMEMLQSASADDQVLCLISGGGSALLPTPRDGLTLNEKIKVNEILLGGGLDICQMNRIRQQLSVLKGGGLLDMAHPAPVRSLMISDVVGDDLGIIASGPTVPTMGNTDAITLLKGAGLWTKLPEAARDLLWLPKPMTTTHLADTELVCSNAQSLAAIAHAAPDWKPQIVKDPLVGDVAHAAESITRHVQTVPGTGRQLIIWGGETTVKITGNGRGGRNQELAVRFARLAKGLPGEWVFLSGGTDGRDGPTDAAGGLVDPRTIAHAYANNINVDAALQDNDSYRILDAAGALLKTGATGTNVADVQLFLRVAE